MKPETTHEPLTNETLKHPTLKHAQDAEERPFRAALALIPRLVAKQDQKRLRALSEAASDAVMEEITRREKEMG